MEIGTTEYLSAAVRLMEAAAKLEDRQRKALERLACVYFERACERMRASQKAHLARP